MYISHLIMFGSLFSLPPSLPPSLPSTLSLRVVVVSCVQWWLVDQFWLDYTGQK